jgi:two-component system response regulator BaeR
MLTARIEETDILTGLKLGADDYICKPFSPREVVARVKAVLRRSRNEILTRELVLGPFSLDSQSCEIKINNRLLKITPNEYGILKAMMSMPNKVFSRKELVSKVQGYSFDGYNRTVDTHIKNLRKKIALHLPDMEVIHSVYGMGYKFKLGGD